MVYIVQLDKSYLRHQPKYFRDSWRGQQYMVFGIIDTVTKKCLIECVPNNAKETLIPIIEEHVHQGSMIYTDGLATYRCLSEKGFVHTSCNHSEGEYVAPDGTNTNTIESLWYNMKTKFKIMRDTRESMLLLHLHEFQYRWNHKFYRDLFDLFLQDISNYYPCR